MFNGVCIASKLHMYVSITVYWYQETQLQVAGGSADYLAYEFKHLLILAVNILLLISQICIASF